MKHLCRMDAPRAVDVRFRGIGFRVQGSGYRVRVWGFVFWLWGVRRSFVNEDRRKTRMICGHVFRNITLI